jgi:hemerythrin HHE cation binding domain-containing protein
MSDFNLDLSGMFAIHDAFRRDLELVAQVDRRTAGWDVFERMLRAHHAIEDDLLWPVVRGAVAGRSDDLALLDQMVAEHAELEPLLAMLDDAFDHGTVTQDARSKLDTLVRKHLEHEETDALPLIDRSLTQAQWNDFNRAAAERIGPDLHVYLPWLLDGTDRHAEQRAVDLLPPPLREAYQHEWRPAWRAVARWAPKVATGAVASGRAR